MAAKPTTKPKDNGVTAEQRKVFDKIQALLKEAEGLVCGLPHIKDGDGGETLPVALVACLTLEHKDHVEQVTGIFARGDQLCRAVSELVKEANPPMHARARIAMQIMDGARR